MNNMLSISKKFFFIIGLIHIIHRNCVTNCNEVVLVQNVICCDDICKAFKSLKCAFSEATCNRTLVCAIECYLVSVTF